MEDEKKLALDLIKALDTAITEGHWDGGIFFQATGKKLRDLRDALKRDIDLDINSETGINQATVNQVMKYSGLIDVYVSLYSAEGYNIHKWEMILSSIGRQSVSRPIYKKEKDVREMINAKETPVNDAYIIAYVSENSITKPYSGKPVLDRFGHELLVLKENSIVAENIAKFIHKSGEYTFEKSRLVKLNQA